MTNTCLDFLKDNAGTVGFGLGLVGGGIVEGIPGAIDGAT